MKTFTKYFTLIIALVAVLSCGEKEQPVGGLGIKMDGIVLGFDKNLIKADGNDEVTFTAYLDGKNVDGQATIYTKGKTGKFTEKVGKIFSTKQPGDYEFIVMYKTKKSDPVVVSAVSRDIPSSVADPQPSKTSFVHRTFFNQYTGVDCPNCPYMVHLLDQTLVNGYEDKVVLACIRNYSSTDTDCGFASVSRAAYYPFLKIDYSTSYEYSDRASAAELQSLIDKWTSTTAKVGISANPVYYEDGQIIVKVSVKAAETGDYHVGLWLMQDEFCLPQSFKNPTTGALGGTWNTGYKGDPTKNRYDYHHNAVRVAASEYMGAHVGFPLGRIEAGKTASWTFLVNVRLEGDDVTSGWWEIAPGVNKVNLNDLHFAAFVTSRKNKGYTVDNVIDFKYNEKRAFEYK